MVQYFFHISASEELQKTVDYYDEISPALSRDFIQQVNQSIHKVLQFPYAYTELYSQVRRKLISKYSYSILYQVYEDHIYILAVMHQHQKPGYWIERLG